MRAPAAALCAARASRVSRRLFSRLRARCAPAGGALAPGEAPPPRVFADAAVRVASAGAAPQSYSRDCLVAPSPYPTSPVLNPVAVGAVGAAAVLFGGVWFASFIAAVVFLSSGEYFRMLQAQGEAEGRELAPPEWAIAVSRAFCTLVPLLTVASSARMKAALTVAAFSLLGLQVLLQRRPRFSQFTSTVFGLFYCGYMPSFWVKLRQLPAPAPGGFPVPDALAASGLGGLWSVGLPATLLTVVCIVAADTAAFVVGRRFGRTPLIRVSPKKTVEGAAAGLGASLAVALAGGAALGWPGSTPAAVALGCLVFAASLFGDLLESVLKRDAGVKDSGTAIPGHGGLLDRFDSYMFTGAVAYLFIKSLLPVLNGLVK